MEKNATRLKKWAQRAELELESENIHIQYIWNPGGFVNQSYQISDGEKRMHVKFADRAHQPSLQQWACLHDYLTGNYEAPKLLMEIHENVIPEYSYGLLFEFFEGETWKGQAWSDRILSQICQLHGDTHLKRVLGVEEKSYADAFIDTYIHRFREDMKIIDADRGSLPFVQEETFDMFHEMADQLEEEVHQSIHFQRPAEDVVHNDLNQQNILVNGDGFCIIDWDDLTVGDAAADFASLLWPWVDTSEWPMWEQKVRGLAGDDVVERMSLYFYGQIIR
ncbi:aminoglycoside phosphotransferase family protein [Halobacillus trueperi]|uniref:aminoglycoside phosphotransferase family protein n=1 Tax=Halobacillus trueperi TaxID=156205 RepID=UPI003736AA12